MESPKQIRCQLTDCVMNDGYGLCVYPLRFELRLVKADEKEDTTTLTCDNYCKE